MKSFSLKLILSLAQVFGSPAFAATETIVKADIIEGQITQKNYLKEKGHFEKNAVGWTGYDDGAATPVDGTGGTVTTTCTRTTSSPISGDGSFLYTPAALGEGCAATFSVDSGDKGRVLQLSFDYSIVSGTYTDDDTTIWIVETSAPAAIQPAPYKLKKTGIIEHFSTEFQTSSSSATYRVLIHQATSGTAVLKFDNFQLGPQAKLYGSAVTDFVAFTPTVSVSTNVSALTGFKRRVGDSAEYIVFIAFNGTNTQGPVTITQPAGETIDTSKLSNTGGDRDVHGLVHIIDSGTSSLTGNVKVESSTSVALNVQGSAGTYTTRTPINTATGVPMTIASGDSFYVQYKVPIVGWSSSQIMSSDASTREVSFKNTGTPSGTLAAAYNTVNWPASATFDTVGGWDGSANYTVKVPGRYRVSANVQINGTFTVGQQISMRVVKTGVTQNTSKTTAGGSLSNMADSITTLVDAVAGDTIAINIYCDATTPTYVASASLHNFTIERISGPSQIAASESVSALYTGAPPTGTLTTAYNTTTFATKVKDSNSAYSSGSYTVPTSGVYSINAGTAQAATYALGKLAIVAIFVDGVQKTTGASVAPGAVSFLYPTVSVHSLPLLAGQVVTIRSYNDATTPTFGSDPNFNYFSIVRTGNF